MSIELAPKHMQPQPGAHFEDFRLVTIKQAADALQLSDRTIVHLMDADLLENVKIGAARRISLASLKRVAREGLSERAYKIVAEKIAARHGVQTEDAIG